MTHPIPVILGPTASSKTAVGIELARRANGEVISVDSRKVYSGLPVGTATPPGQWRDGAYWVENVAHHLIAHLTPDQAYTAGDFVRDATERIEAIEQRGRLPILVGGTGFYFKALRDGLPALPPRDLVFRAGLEQRIKEQGLAAAFEELRASDPAAATKIGPGDRHKIIRALEIIASTHRPYSEWKKTEPRGALARTFVVAGLDFDKAVLEKRIETRSRAMAEGGMIEETAAALAAGYAADCPALAGFGYHEAVDVIQGRLARADFLPSLISGTKAYAKRQRTYFRTQVRPLWFNCGDSTPASGVAGSIHSYLQQRSA